MHEKSATAYPLTFPVELERQLRSQGIYPTPQRLLIAYTLLSSHQHVTAEQLFECLKRKTPRLSKATVYNTLGLFLKKGLLREVFVDASRTFYDSNTSPHHHFYNVDTGELTDFDEKLAQFTLNCELPAGTELQSAEIMIRVRKLPD